MPQILVNDFSKGWCPSDDAVNGRKDALLNMDGLDLEQNGAVRMTGGSVIVSAAAAAAAHTLYSTYLGGQKYRYLALQNGHVSRNGTVIVTNNGYSRTAFGKSFDKVLIFSGNARVQDDGFAPIAEEVALPSPPNAALPFTVVATSTFDGDYEWKFVYINRSGSSIRRSKASPISTSLTLNSTQGIQLTIENPHISLGYTEVDEIWIYRRGGALDAFYKTQVVLSIYFGGSNYFSVFDNFNDADVLDNGEILNEFVTSVNYIDTPEEILEIVGPINTRHFYFTATRCLITERNSPSTYDTRNVINISAAAGEIFLFARQVGENTIVVGTTENLYTISGTFDDLPDGFIDAYFRGLNVSEKPISYSACTFGAALIYLSQAGWQLLDINAGTFENLVAPNIDRLYNNETCHGVTPMIMYAGGSFRYPCVVSNGRLYVLVITNNGFRLECYDFSRKYWRTFLYGNNLGLLAAEDDGTLLGFSFTDYKIRELDVKTTKSVDGANQQISMLTPFYDGGLPRNRKETQAFKFKALTGGVAATITLYTDDNVGAYTRQWTISSAVLTEFNLNVDDLVARSYQVKVDGLLQDFLFTDFSITYEPLPEALSYLKIKPKNLGTPARKLIPNFPIVIDTMGDTINAFVNGDGGANLAATSISTLRKQTVSIYPNGLVPTVDYEIILQSLANSEKFEFYEELQSKFIEVYPEQLVRYQSPTMNFGSFGEKAVVVWPLTIDTLGTNVSFEAFLGLVPYPAGGPIVFNHSFKKTVNFVFNPVLQGVDFYFKLTGGTFELWEVGKPEIVRTYPVSRTYDVISGVELDRFVKVRKIEIRIVGGSSTAIPVEILIQGQSAIQKMFTPLPFTEDIISIDIPKTVSGRVMEIRIGPSDQPFKRISTNVQYAASDRDTELKWAAL